MESKDKEYTVNRREFLKAFGMVFGVCAALFALPAVPIKRIVERFREKPKPNGLEKMTQEHKGTVKPRRYTWETQQFQNRKIEIGHIQTPRHPEEWWKSIKTKKPAYSEEELRVMDDWFRKHGTARKDGKGLQELFEI